MRDGRSRVAAVDSDNDHLGRTVDDSVGYPRDLAGGRAGDTGPTQGRCDFHAQGVSAGCNNGASGELMGINFVLNGSEGFRIGPGSSADGLA